MLSYIFRRILYMIPTLIAISVVSFIVIQLPSGDYLTSMVAGMAEQGETVDQTQLAALEERYSLDQPWYVQYWKWISGILLRGDFGQSFEWNQPVSSLIWDRLGLTFLLSLSTLLFVWAVAIPIGIYSAVKKIFGWGLRRHLFWLHSRCRYAKDRCKTEEPKLRDVGSGHLAACHFAEELTLRGVAPDIC